MPCRYNAQQTSYAGTVHRYTKNVICHVWMFRFSLPWHFLPQYGHVIGAHTIIIPPYLCLDNYISMLFIHFQHFSTTTDFSLYSE
jgi:hypothetical protein